MDTKPGTRERRWSSLFVLLAALTALAILLAACQMAMAPPLCGGNISSGSDIHDVTDRFTPSCSYYFDGAAGEIVTIRMTRQSGTSDNPNNLDPFLMLLDPNDNTEVTDDDSGLPPPNSLIKEHKLEATGKYTIVAGSYNDTTVGPFDLTFSKNSP